MCIFVLIYHPILLNMHVCVKPVSHTRIISSPGSATYSLTTLATPSLNGTVRQALQYGYLPGKPTYRFRTGPLTVKCKYYSPQTLISI